MCDGRSGYSEDCEGPELVLWRGAVERAIHGRRGQRFFRELIAALDSLPEKKLCHGELRAEDGTYCALGVVADRLGVLGDLDNSAVEHDAIGRAIDIAPSLVREVEWVNDEQARDRDDAARYRRVRAWAENRLRKDEDHA